MEIIATHTDIAAKVVILVFIGLITLLLWLYAWLEEDSTSFVGAIIVTLVFFALFSLDTTIFYDVIVTDWNAVYDQGYEVVEQNGKIVTLRKVGD